MSDTTKLTLDVINEALEGDGIAFRRRTRMQPAGGSGDKIFPPTYEGGKYCEEDRRIEGKDVKCVLVDSVASQANRMELALKEAFYKGKGQDCLVPVIVVDFAAAGLPEVGEVTSLEAPHRIADAILRDSRLGDVIFEESEMGKRFLKATSSSASGLLELCPTALLFGMWNSTGKLGGMGTKVQRAIVSEMVAVEARLGYDVSSRIDPLQIRAGVLVYEASSSDLVLKYTVEADKARKKKEDASGETADSGKKAKGAKPDANLVLYGEEQDSSGKWKGANEAGRPSKVNHGNVTPGLVRDQKTKQVLHRGVTCDYVMQSTVLSLAALRRLRFELPGKEVADVEGRAAVAALGLCAATLMNMSQAYDLRSRCNLAPEASGAWELLDSRGQSTQFSLGLEESTTLLAEAIKAATGKGLPWMRKPLVLEPSSELVGLIKKSQDVAQQERPQGEE